ncbi:hypothetical protein G4B88_005013 [Cannabis sativa]|uniref:Reticulon domain-containing protein n=1 Tax=Cannabis sativa TaxID=3483 RepID=A0A7J6H4R8_CANSA|nr:hypothetical protein G4B88_005013 [Cannabis sativa]
MDDDIGSKRRVGTRSTVGVVSGSVWESRMKHDEVRGGIKVFIAGEEGFEDQSNGNTPSSPSVSVSSPSGNKLRKGVGNGNVGGGKRKMWKWENFDGFERSPIQNNKGKSDEQQVKEVSGDGAIKRSPIQGRRLRSEGNVGNKELVKSPIGMRKTRSESLREARESGEGIERNSVPAAPLRKAKSVSVSVPARASVGGGESVNGIGLVKVKSETNEVLDESMDGSVEEIEKSPIENVKSGSDEGCKEFGVCEEKAISNNVELLKSAPKCDDEHEEEQDEEEHYGDEVVVEGEEEIEVEKKSVEEIKKPEPVPEEPEPESKPPEPEPEPKPKPNKIVYGEKVVNEVKKVHFERRDVKKLHQAYQKQPEPMSLNVKKQLPPVTKRATVHSSFAKSSASAASDDYHSFPENHSSLQSFVDLIMWKEISRSVFIFGIGTFTIISSAYTRDLNISFISVLSYMGLVYLAATFLFRAIICRGVIDTDYKRYVLGEEEAIWLLKLVLPYLNEFLLKLKALFSGDPSTTMKVKTFSFSSYFIIIFESTFVLRRLLKGWESVTMAAGSIALCFGQVWQLHNHLDNGEIGIFWGVHRTKTKFWVRRFRDAWDSCSHKKAVTVAAFLLVWNLSSIVARIWADYGDR